MGPQRPAGASQEEAEHTAPEVPAHVQQQSPEGAQEDDEQEEEDEEEDNPPLLFVDVNLGASEQQRIVVYDGDTAQELAARFCEEHELDDDTQEKLEQLLEQQISSVLTKIEEGEEDG